MSTRIQVLDDSTINKIAAGEVVERPASVVKELVENAIDAGSTNIEVEIMGGGTSFMRVTDNGCGMSEEDARQAIKRHATSKIHEVTDLLELSTLGFRGEALPTIASVSRFHLLTRPQDADLGTQVKIEGGKLQDISAAGCAPGTTISVEDLFFNTPARKKFLKTNHTEASHINDFMVKLALSRPDIGFRFINNGKLSISTPGKGSLRDTIAAIYGKKTEESLLELKLEDEDLRISGFITKPSMLKSNRSWQTYIVNGRVISNKAIAKAIDNAYKAMVPKSGFPLAVLYIEVPQRSIDVNVHPQKAELKFADESAVFRAVYKATKDAIRPQADRSLGEVAAVVERPHMSRMPEYIQPEMHFSPGSSAPAEHAVPVGNAMHAAPASLRRETGYRAPGRQTMADFTAAGAKIQSERRSYEPQLDERVPQERMTVGEPRPSDSSAGTAEDLQEASRAVPSQWGQGGMVPIGQVALTYIIAQDEDGLYIIDQHAAHERILFDKFSRQAEGIPAQQLLLHKILSFDAQEAALIDAHQDLLDRLGFHLEPAGDHEYRLTEVPMDIKAEEGEDCVREILTELQQDHREASARDIRQACLATTACRAAIKAGEVLNIRQMQIILEELSHTDYPFTCPHGRPTILKFSQGDLAKMFKRTGFDLHG